MAKNKAKNPSGTKRKDKKAASAGKKSRDRKSEHKEKPTKKIAVAGMVFICSLFTDEDLACEPAATSLGESAPGSRTDKTGETHTAVGNPGAMIMLPTGTSRTTGE